MWTNKACFFCFLFSFLFFYDYLFVKTIKSYLVALFKKKGGRWWHIKICCILPIILDFHRSSPLYELIMIIVTFNHLPTRNFEVITFFYLPIKGERIPINWCGKVWKTVECLNFNSIEFQQCRSTTNNRKNKMKNG